MACISSIVSQITGSCIKITFCVVFLVLTCTGDLKQVSLFSYRQPFEFSSVNTCLIFKFVFFVFQSIIAQDCCTKVVTCLAYGISGNDLISRLEDGVVRVWDARTHNILRVFKHAKGYLNSI
ncbi:hypothetical protein DVH24_020677 [Malus domestica]|uniref:Uncharacterized protein n=1 Tax=Malus domestica TaxID=3750 RepID=A0A498JC21_MALDO|nr:hypothetical protein DVH24_020677 [Malus domestica]